MVASKRRESQKTTDRKFFAITWFCAPNGRIQKAGPTTASPYKTVNRRRKLPESYTVRAIPEDGPYKTVARGSHRRPASDLLGFAQGKRRPLQRLKSDFFEHDDVVVAVILEAEPAFVGTRAVLGLEIEFAFGHGLALGVIGDFDAVEEDDGVRAIERDFHGVPFGAGLAGFGERLGEGIERAGDVIFVFVRSFGMIIDLDFIAVVDGHPGFARFDG